MFLFLAKSSIISLESSFDNFKSFKFKLSISICPRKKL